MFLHTLSGRFLVLTVLFVILAEVLIFVPSVARFRADYMADRLERAQIASLSLLAEEAIRPELERELLENAGVFNVVLQRDEVRELVLSSDLPSPVSATYDIRQPAPGSLVRDALARLLKPAPEVVRVIGHPVQDAGLLIEVTMPTGPLREEMLDYGLRILLLSAAISAVAATLLFLAVHHLMVRPMRAVVSAVQSYAEAPEDTRRIIEPSSRTGEIGEAEAALKSMQTELTSVLRHRERLASLGSAVAKVSHDLRNILTSAQLFADRIEASDDPAVARMLPKLMSSISRAVHLCERTLAFGKAEEPPPALMLVNLAAIVEDVVDAEQLASETQGVAFSAEVPPGMTLRADAEQLYRVLSNLVRNARQAMEATKSEGEVRIAATEDDTCWRIKVSDTGPGLPSRARKHLFTPFQGGASKGGAGLGLAISAELVRGHGGRLSLGDTGPDGTTFFVTLPKAMIEGEEAFG